MEHQPTPQTGNTRPAALDAGDTASSPYRLWRDRRYLTWLVSDTMTGLAGALSGFAIPLVALAITGSPMYAGLIGAASMVARLIATIAGGVIADRHNRLLLMALGSGIGAILAAAFTVLAATDALTFSSLLLLSVLLAVRGGTFEVAGESAIKEIVPDQAMGRAQAANQARDAALGLAGGPLGGVLLAAGAWFVGAVMALCQGVALMASLALRGKVPTGRRTSPISAPDTPASSAWVEVREGVTWVLGRPDLRGVLLVSTVANLGFNTGMTAVIYSLQLAGFSPQAIGGLSAIIAAAMLVAAIVSPMLVSRFTAGSLMLVGLALGTMGILAVGAFDSFGAIAATLAFSLFGLPALNAAILGYMTVATPTRLLGRVNSAARTMAMGAMPLAPLVAGTGLAWIGRSGTLLAAGAICVAAVVLVLATSSLRALPREADWAAHAARFSE